MGNYIDRIDKHQKVTFRDNIEGTDIKEVILVKSYKSHNRLSAETSKGAHCCLIY